MAEPVFTLVGARGRKYLTAEERTRFLAAARADPRPAVQTFAATLAHTGARISEALATRACDVDLDAAELRVRTLKRRREHWRAVRCPWLWCTILISCTGSGAPRRAIEDAARTVADPCISLSDRIVEDNAESSSWCLPVCCWGINLYGTRCDSRKQGHSPDTGRAPGHGCARQWLVFGVSCN